MFTDCPSCQRQFRIYAAQLSAAGGVVKCGYCGQQFNAIERLHDKPLVAKSAEIPQDLEEQSSDAEPQFDIPNAVDDIQEDDSFDISGEESASAQQDESDADQDQEVFNKSAPSEESQERQAIEIPDQGPPSPLQDKSETEQEEDLNAQQEVSGEGSIKEEGIDSGYNFSEELLSEHAPKPSMLRRLVWITGSSLLILFVLIQVAWFNRDELLDRYPKLTPWVNKLCAELECEPIRHRDLSAIKLINRDVRDHPRYEKALLVNATMSNQSHTAQAFPVVRLTLFNSSGMSIGYRSFSPDDYLDESINIFKGMIPSVPVHFVLEVTGSTEEAVSFEFDFL